MNKLFCFLFLFLTFSHIPTKAQQDTYLQAPYDYTIQKQYYKKRFGDITTSGRFIVFSIVFTNKDTKEHTIDYDCFRLTGPNGIEYKVHTEATIVRQTRFEDWRIKDVDVTGFNRKTLKPNIGVKGYLIFEVPTKDDYKITFKGYLTSQKTFRL